MNNGNSNVIVYVQGPVRAGQARAISAAIGSLNGVVHAENSARTENAICVDYDPGVINSQHIIRYVHDQGVRARLVGM